MAVCLATRNEDVRSSETRRQELIVRLLRVYRAARLVASGSEAGASGHYRINPGDMLHLRTVVDAARNIVRSEGVETCR